MAGRVIRVGTRGSKLALIQAGHVRDAIARAVGRESAAELVRITTSGDRIQDRRLMDIGGKGLFTKEIEEALLEERIDCAVHSLKDMPAEGPPGLAIAAIPQRADPRDAFVSARFERFEDLPPGARLGTASLRRQAQALRRRPDPQRSGALGRPAPLSGPSRRRTRQPARASQAGRPDGVFDSRLGAWHQSRQRGVGGAEGCACRLR